MLNDTKPTIKLSYLVIFIHMLKDTKNNKDKVYHTLSFSLFCVYPKNAMKYPKPL